MISLIHPSRSRPEKSLETINTWFARHSSINPNNGANVAINDIELIVSCDLDDKSIHEYEKIYQNFYFNYSVLLSISNKSAVEAINNAAKIAKGDIFIVVSDDTDCPQDWDKIILEATEGKTDFLLRVSDGIQKRICTLPIMDRTYYNRFGYIYNPIYRHAWVDTELTEVAYSLGRIIVRNDIKFPHLHPEVTKEPKDALYLRNDKTHDEDRHIFEARKRINFGL